MRGKDHVSISSYLEQVRVHDGSEAYELSRALLTAFGKAQGNTRLVPKLLDSLVASVHEGKVHLDTDQGHVYYRHKDGRHVVFGSDQDPLFPKMVRLVEGIHADIWARRGIRGWWHQLTRDKQGIPKSLRGVVSRLNYEVVERAQAEILSQRHR